MTKIQARDIQAGMVIKARPAQVHLKQDGRCVRLALAVSSGCPPLDKTLFDSLWVDINVVLCELVEIQGKPYMEILHHRHGGRVYVGCEESVEITEIRQFKPPQHRPPIRSNTQTVQTNPAT